MQRHACVLGGVVVLCACGGGGEPARPDAATDAADPVDAPPGDAAWLLPDCPDGPTLTRLPLAASAINGITPLGALNPPAHTLPTYHTYVIARPGDAPVPVVVPGDGWITAITSTQATGLPGEHVVTFQPCKQQSFYFNHLEALAAPLEAAFRASDPMCETTPATGGGDFTRCVASTFIPVTAGELLSLERVDPMWNTAAFDFGGRDARLAVPGFANLARYGCGADPSNFDLCHVLCPFDAMPADVKAVAEGLMGDGFATPLVPRTAPPRCGTTMQDVVGTAAGNWFTYPANGQLPREDQAIALVTHAGSGTHGVLSIGGPSNLAVRPHLFTTASSGRVNRPFSAVTAGDGIYCYQALRDQLNQSLGELIVLVEVTAEGRLRIEQQAAATCGAGPWSFGSEVAVLDR